MGSEIIVASLTIGWCGLKGLAMADMLYEKAHMGSAVSRVSQKEFQGLEVFRDHGAQ